MIDFSYIDGATIRTAEAKIAGAESKDVDFSQDIAGGRHHGDCPLAVTSHVEISVDVASHPVETVIRKLFEESAECRAAT